MLFAKEVRVEVLLIFSWQFLITTVLLSIPSCTCSIPIPSYFVTQIYMSLTILHCSRPAIKLSANIMRILRIKKGLESQFLICRDSGNTYEKVTFTLFSSTRPGQALERRLALLLRLDFEDLGLKESLSFNIHTGACPHACKRDDIMPYRLEHYSNCIEQTLQEAFPLSSSCCLPRPANDELAVWYADLSLQFIPRFLGIAPEIMSSSVFVAMAGTASQDTFRGKYCFLMHTSWMIYSSPQFATYDSTQILTKGSLPSIVGTSSHLASPVKLDIFHPLSTTAYWQSYRSGGHGDNSLLSTS